MKDIEMKKKKTILKEIIKAGALSDNDGEYYEVPAKLFDDLYSLYVLATAITERYNEVNYWELYGSELKWRLAKFEDKI